MIKRRRRREHAKRRQLQVLLLGFLTFVTGRAAATPSTTATSIHEGGNRIEVEVGGDAAESTMLARNDTNKTTAKTSTNHTSRISNNTYTGQNVHTSTLVIDDANFKPLIQHCLSLQVLHNNPRACDGMGDWDISRVKDCSRLLWSHQVEEHAEHAALPSWKLVAGAEAFNVNLRYWNTSSCTTMMGMFHGATEFDAPIGNWDTSRVTNFAHMFNGAQTFNRDISGFNVEQATDMSHMFEYASRFHNPSLQRWNVARVTDMSYMFHTAIHFNGAISKWNTSSVKHFEAMFQTADLFNQEIGEWDVSKAEDNRKHEQYALVGMFQEAHDFNQDISAWQLGPNVHDLTFMFREAKQFNQDLSSWSVASVTNMSGMFTLAVNFQQVLCWNITASHVDLTNMFEGTKPGAAIGALGIETAKCWGNEDQDPMMGTSTTGGELLHGGASYPQSSDQNHNFRQSHPQQQSTPVAWSPFLFLRTLGIVCFSVLAMALLAIAGRLYVVRQRETALAEKIKERSYNLYLCGSGVCSSGYRDDEQGEEDEYMEEQVEFEEQRPASLGAKPLDSISSTVTSAEKASANSYTHHNVFVDSWLPYLYNPAHLLAFGESQAATKIQDNHGTTIEETEGDAVGSSTDGQPGKLNGSDKMDHFTESTATAPTERIRQWLLVPKRHLLPASQRQLLAQPRNEDGDGIWISDPPEIKLACSSTCEVIPPFLAHENGELALESAKFA